MTATSLALASSLSAPLWEWPALAAVQFPWRLLGPTALGGALVAAAALPARAWLLAPLSAIVVVSQIALLQPSDRDVAGADAHLTPGAAVRRELTDGTIGATTAAEYLPQAARAGFAPDRHAPPIVDGPNLEAAQLMEAGPLGARFQVRASEPTRVRLHAFWFPGWRATIDGHTTPTVPDGPYGLVAVAVPAGDHTVAIWFGDTAPRVAGWILAAAAAVALIAVGARAIGVVGLLTIVALSVGPGVAARPVAATLASAEFGPIRLVGGVARWHGSTARVTLYWQNLSPGYDAALGLRALDEHGVPLDTRRARAVYGTSPTSSWSVNELTRDERALFLPDARGPITLQAMVDERWTTIGALPAPPPVAIWPFRRFDDRRAGSGATDCPRTSDAPEFGGRIALRASPS
ncbi:MAG: hypothetical protein NZ518_10440, partial [Dehalococcoidia bacterium]|nr:hypothetical protein [Dehalococcoidia bacterium]